MKWRGRRMVLVVLALLALVVGTVILSRYWQARRAVANYRKQLIAAGEKLTVAELIPPPPLESENGAELFYKARALLNTRSGLLDTNPPYAMSAVAPGKALIRWQQPFIRDTANGEASNSWAEVEAEMARLAPSLALLDQLADKSTIDFHYDYQQGFSGLLPNLAPLKQSAQLLGAATVFALHEGDTAAATAHLRGMLAIVRGGTHERLVISQLVRYAIAAIALGPTLELLQSPHLTEEQLVALQHDWSELEFLTATENAQMMERAIGEMTIGDMRESSAEFKKATTAFAWPGGGTGGGVPAGSWYDQATHFAKNTWEGTKDKSREIAWRVAWSYPDQLHMLQGKQVLIESLRQVRTNGSFFAALTSQQQRLAALGFLPEDETQDFGNLFNNEPDLKSLFSGTVVALVRVINKVMIIETGKQLVTTAIALHRYKLRHGKFPAELTALLPDFLPALPRDPVNGLPLHYRRNDDGSFLLYSVGPDGEDNHGDARNANEKSTALGWQSGRDLVWPQPASTNEIEAYFEKKSR